LGGCCAAHSIGKPIFPTEFSIEKLERFRKRLGTYFFSCQFLNEPVNPEQVHFDTKYLRYYKFYKDSSFQRTEVDGLTGQVKTFNKVMIQHQVRDGQVVSDYNPSKLSRYMIIDPNHAGNDGRCRHAITVTGVLADPRRIYLLDVWAKACSLEEFIETIFNIALAWKVQNVYVETIAAQKYLFYHLNYIMPTKRLENVFFKIMRFKELKTPKTANAKKIRIESLGPIFERGEFWINEVGMGEFLEEYKSYPAGKLKDVLDTLGYGPQVWDKPMKPGSQKAILEARHREYLQLTART
jgi:hypothetical protein